MEANQRLSSANDLEAMERGVREQEAQLVQDWPKRLSGDGLVKVTIRTAQGVACEVQARYYRHKGRGGHGQRGRELYPGLVLLGIHARCSPGLASEISQLTALLGSLEEARGVLSERGVVLNIKTVRSVSYAYAERARRVQQLAGLEIESGVAGRRVVISCDSGRVRLREPKSGRKTAKGRTRYKERGANRS